MTILIPAYKPDQRLLTLVNQLRRECSDEIVIVDDGSGPQYAEVFQEALQQRCVVLRHEINQGKGRALKTGFTFIKQSGESSGVVCADCDGQHLPQDVRRIAEAIPAHRTDIILGTRGFTGRVPFRSRFGNSVTRTVFALASGIKIPDTQTGLRGFSIEMLDWLCSIPGERFEYEMNMLLLASQSGFGIHQVKIATLYPRQNHSTHFRTIPDAIRVYLPIVKFSASSLVAGLVDFALLLLIKAWTANLLLAVVTARVISALLNYTANRCLVFSRGREITIKGSLPRYSLLASCVLLLNYLLLHFLNEVALFPLVFAKMLTELLIFLFSFWCQTKFVFKRR